ncbi:MAG: hypothetical protein JNM27_11400 [Leptospirales bacterium]|nr:hypothetical protein [Leptospirales bacterium]
MGRMPVRTVTAMIYIKQMSGGRTKPLLLACGDSQGSQEFIVKLTSRVDMGLKSLVAEFVAAGIARQAGLMTPETVLVEVLPDFVGTVTIPEDRVELQKSQGLNFGSLNLTPGYTTWLRNQALPSELRTLALQVFVFDALIENPDRRPEKPNLLGKADDLAVIDHELALGFDMALSRKDDPSKWYDFLKDHIFFSDARKRKTDVRQIAMDFIGSIDVESVIAELPTGWSLAAKDRLDKIRDHFKMVQGRATDVCDGLMRVLE